MKLKNIKPGDLINGKLVHAVYVQVDYGNAVPGICGDEWEVLRGGPEAKIKGVVRP